MASKGKNGSKKKKKKKNSVNKTSKPVQATKEKKEEQIVEQKEEEKKSLDENTQKIDKIPEDTLEKTKIKESNEDKTQKEPKDVTKEKTSLEKKHNSFNIILIAIFIIIITVFSTIFSLLNQGNSNIVKGVSIKGIDVSGLSVEDAAKKIENALNIELMQNLTIKYEDKYTTNFHTNQIEFLYYLEEAIKEAYNVGRKGNIVQNNYELLYSVLIGKNIDVQYTYNEENLNKFISDTEAKLPGVVVEPTYYIEGEQLIINKGIDGIGINKEQFKREILNNIKNRNADKIVKDNKEEELEISIISKKAELIDIETIYKQIYTEPKDAYYELEPFNIYPEVNGIDLKIGIEEAKKYIENEEKEEYIFDLKITPPEKTIKSFGIEAFQNLVSSFSTKYDASNINRSKNLEIAAEKINGIVLMPGEVFSFNQIVGKRTVEEGYRDAKIYVDGGVVDGLAGGICQISSTLYNAVLLANLEIVERRNHSFTTSYVPAGRDATVVYGTTDFQFKNSRTYPIKLEAAVHGGIASFKIHSVAPEENEYEVKIKPVITQSIPYQVEHIQDVSLLPGQQIVVQSGQSGYRVTTYKELLQDGVVISKEAISNDVYKAMRSIIRIGP